MKATTSLVVLFSSLIPFTLANFDIYQAQDNNAITGQTQMWQIFEAEPDCDQVNNLPWYIDSDDVSGQKDGVRCEPSGTCSQNPDPADIQILEMNFNGVDPIYHWTIYKDRNLDMIGLDGNVYGNCIPFPGDDYSCGQGISGRSGVRKFRCLIDVTAQQIYDTY